jgi:hypothetical protein
LLTSGDPPPSTCARAPPCHLYLVCTPPPCNLYIVCTPPPCQTSRTHPVCILQAGLPVYIYIYTHAPPCTLRHRIRIVRAAQRASYRQGYLHAYTHRPLPVSYVTHTHRARLAAGILLKLTFLSLKLTFLSLLSRRAPTHRRRRPVPRALHRQLLTDAAALAPSGR